MIMMSMSKSVKFDDFHDVSKSAIFRDFSWFRCVYKFDGVDDE